jgi:hypothetical protein
LRKPSIPNLSSKHFTTEAISHLEEVGLIKQSKEIDLRRKRQCRQKKNMELTEFGSELSKSIRGIEQYTEYYSKLTSIIKERFDISEDTKKEISSSEFRHKLENKEWRSDDIKNYRIWLEQVFNLEYLSSLAIFDILIARYASIIFKYSPEGISKEILNKLIVDTIREYLMDRVEEFLSKRLSTDNNARKKTFNDIFYGISGHAVSYFMNFAPPTQLNKFIQNESIGLVESLYSILSPPKGFLARTMEKKANRDPNVKEQLKFLEGLDKSS